MIAQGVCCYFSCVSWDRKVPGAQQSFLFVLMQLYNQAKFHIVSGARSAGASCGVYPFGDPYGWPPPMTSCN